MSNDDWFGSNFEVTKEEPAESEKQRFGGIKTDDGGRPVMDEGGRPVNEVVK